MDMAMSVLLAAVAAGTGAFGWMHWRRRRALWREGGIAGWVLPRVRLGQTARSRRRAIERCLPGVLDWLALSVEAGEGFAQALSRISAQMAPGPLREELGRLNAELQTGVVRRVALRSLSARAHVPALSSFCALLIQADVLGTSIGPVLRGVSQRLRSERFARAERQGIAAAQKALFPLVLCIMPATFLVVFGPLIVRLVTEGPRMFLGG